MISKQALELFLEKKVFVGLVNEERAQVGILKKIGEDFFLESYSNFTLINPDAVSRITEEKR